MEAVPSSAADHVREIKAEWDALEARDQRSPSAEFLMKDQVLLQKVKELLHRFNEHPRSHSKHGGGWCLRHAINTLRQECGVTFD